MSKAAPSLMPQKFSHKSWNKREKTPKQRKNQKLFRACFWTSVDFILANFFFKPWKKIPRLFSGHEWCKFNKKKSWQKFSVCPWNMRGYLLQSILEKHSSPTHLIQTSFFSWITVFSVKNVVLYDPFFPFRNQPWIALEAGKNILHSIR